jgi:hypothetical protein
MASFNQRMEIHVIDGQPPGAGGILVLASTVQIFLKKEPRSIISVGSWWPLYHSGQFSINLSHVRTFPGFF